MELCDLLTLEENGVDKDEIISLRLSEDDENCDEVPKEKAAIDDEYLQDLSSKIKSSWKELAKHLGYEEADIQTTNEGSTEESRHMLLTWWEKTTDRDEAAQKLRRALEAIGLTDLAQNVPVTGYSRDEAAGPEPESRQEAGVDEESKQNRVASTEEEKLKREQVDDQDKPRPICFRYVQVFIQCHVSHKAKTLCFRMNAETSVFTLKHMINEKISVQPQQQRLYIRRNFRNFELCNLLTLHDCGIHQDENISLRLSTDGLLGGGPTDKHLADDQFFRDLASKTESCWEELAKSLRYEDAAIKQFQTTSQENTERSLQMLRSWWGKQTNREEGFQSLRDALNSIGRAELASMIPSEKQQRMKQEELGHLDKPQPSVQTEETREHNTQKGTTSSEGQRLEQEEVADQGKRKTNVQLGGAMKHRRQKETTSSQGQGQRQEEVAEQGQPQIHVQGEIAQEQGKQKRTKPANEEQRPSQELSPKKQKLGEFEKNVQQRTTSEQQKGTTSFHGQRPGLEEVVHRDKAQSFGEVGGAKDQSSQEGTTLTEDQTPRQGAVSHRDKPQSELQVREAKERSRQKETTTSEGQRPRREEVGHRDKLQPEVQVEGATERSMQEETTTSEGQRPRQDVGHQDTLQPEVQVGGSEEQSKQKGTTSSKGQRPRKKDVGHSAKSKPEAHVGLTETESKSERRRDSQSQGDDSAQGIQTSMPTAPAGIITVVSLL
ncbi:trichohyalin-like [Patiria miniata]|uniref:Death domain-containing protein n=1 Tax=Patiria miniata TaxID=46514 RepID=A0A913ZNW0_PATMI|nr:trichohyalin-like [Patiria miniata]